MELSPKAMRDHIDHVVNCEDIGFTFHLANVTGLPPVWIDMPTTNVAHEYDIRLCVVCWKEFCISDTSYKYRVEQPGGARGQADSLPEPVREDIRAVAVGCHRTVLARAEEAGR